MDCSASCGFCSSLRFDLGIHLCGSKRRHPRLSMGSLRKSNHCTGYPWSESAENKYLRHRLKEFSKDYHILKVSHGQLEEFMAGNRLSVRQALQQLKPMLTSNTSDEIKAGSELMAVFAQFGAVQVAGLYGTKEQDRLDPKPVATHGGMPELNLFDPLIKLAIDSKQLVSVKLAAQETESVESDLLAVVPIVDSHGHLHGVLAIKDMHFMAFQQENLNVLSLLGSYVGDMLTRSKSEGESRSGWFMAELSNAVRFARQNNVTSSMLALRLTPNEKTQYLATGTIRKPVDNRIPLTSDERNTG